MKVALDVAISAKRSLRQVRGDGYAVRGAKRHRNAFVLSPLDVKFAEKCRAAPFEQSLKFPRKENKR